MSRPPPAVASRYFPTPARPRRSRFFTAAFAVALFFIVVGGKWAVVDRFGSDLPFWDQWDAEGLHLLVPWFEHGNFLPELFLPHNEHRVVLTKLQSLALVLASGQWDSRLECVVNALLHGAVAVALWLAARRWLDGCWHAPLFVLLAALFGLPFAWENVISGFHSQQFWLLGLSLAALLALPFARPWRAGWFAAVFAAALALLTMGSGFFAAAAVLPVVALRLLRGDTTVRSAWPTLLVGVALTGIGWFTHVEVPYHDELKAKTAHDFSFSIVHSLQWPAPLGDNGWAALVLWLPFVLVAWQVLRLPRGTDGRVPQTIVALGGWVLMQVVAAAYARGAGADYPASRYMDTLAFGMAVNGLALGWHGAHAPASRVRSVARAALVVAWFGVLAWGLYDNSRFALMEGMPERRRLFDRAEVAMRAYLATNDRRDLVPDDIPYPVPDYLAQRLEHASLRALMPVGVRPTLPLRAGPGGNGIFGENHADRLTLDAAPRNGLPPAAPAFASRTTWGSFGPGGAAARGEWTSAPLTAPLGGWLAFETSGDIGESGNTLELCDAQTGARLAEVLPTKIPLDTWRTAYVRAPLVPFVVVARDEDSHHWLAFSAPVEMSSLSHFAWQAARNGLLIAELALGAAALLALAAIGWKREPPPGSTR